MSEDREITELLHAGLNVIRSFTAYPDRLPKGSQRFECDECGGPHSASQCGEDCGAVLKPTSEDLQDG